MTGRQPTTEVLMRVGKHWVGVALAATMTLGGIAVSAPRPADAADVGSRFVAVTPQRVIDSRPGEGPSDDGVSGLVNAGEIVEVQVAGRMGVPLTGVSAVVLNVTVTETLGAGYVQVFPSGPVTIGSSSSLNVEFTGQTIANQVTVPVGAGGRVSIYLQSGGHVLADVFGYYTPVESATSGRYTPLAAPSPRRVLDTRDLTQVPIANPGDVRNCTDFATWDAAWRFFWTYHRWGDPAGLDGDGDGVPCNSLPGAKTTAAPTDLFKLAGGSTIRIPVTTGTDLPGGVAAAGQASAVVANVTVTEASAVGFWQVLPTGGAVLGSSSNLNINAVGQTISNQVIVPLGADGTITIYSQNGGHVLVDIAGVFTGTSSPSSSDGLFVPVTPSRLVDTRDPGNTPLTGPIPATTGITVQTAGRFGIPSGVAAVALNATITAAAAPGFVQVYPTGGATPGASSNINAERTGQTIANATYTSVDGSGHFSIYTQSGGQLLADVAGWFTATQSSFAPTPVISDPSVTDPPATPPPPTNPPVTSPPVTTAPVLAPVVGPLVTNVIGGGRVVVEAPNSDRCASATWTVNGPTSYSRSVEPPPGGCWDSAHRFDTSWDNGIWTLTPGTYSVSLTLTNVAGSTTSSTSITMPAAAPPVTGPLTVEVIGGGRAIIEAPQGDRCATAVWSVTGPTPYTRTVQPPAGGCWGTAHAFDTSWDPRWLLAPGLHTVTLTLTRAGGWISSSTTTLVMPARVVTVGASGADFTSVTAALASIGDATETNPTLVRIAAGTFVEPTITLKVGVHLQGAGQGATTIVAGVVADRPSPWGSTPRQEIRSLTVQGNLSISHRLVVLDRVTLRGGIGVAGKSNGASLLMVNSEIYNPAGYGIANSWGSVTVRDSSITAVTPLAPTYSGSGYVSVSNSMLSTATINVVPDGPISNSCTDSFIRPGYWSGQTFIPTGPFRSTTARCA